MLIAIIILICSFLGILVILFRKIPALVEISSGVGISQPNVFSKLKNGAVNQVKSFSFNNFLQKLLLRIKILTLKTENKTGVWIEKLRQKTKEEEKTCDKGSSDNYWEQLKKK
ncbi:MAG: hypothetical protein COV63_01685 [Candidatus Nealsonbacteria bacterium CG11_big_fil_rev_8_21_14_0_20_37_68]|nr:MAG: hypothetical protein COV63_01685 [Candidatus Nealsonbacteria bacterium CG11_big_fil_rev_8_21_14_0_20_37_68]PIW91911.1 MAG: hypothetical protein COZ89_02645 [Candidatus Nealsonbacteria bacterium CG_4_8_14_3_um_filter_37_23]